jgi:hypothetical protein
MGLGIGSVIFSPTAILFGKRPVYLFSSIIFVASAVWCALSPSFTSLLLARIFQGIAVSPVECLPSATIAEIFFLHERAFRIGEFSQGTVLGHAPSLVDQPDVRYIHTASPWREKPHPSYQRCHYSDPVLEMGLLVSGNNTTPLHLLILMQCLQDYRYSCWCLGNPALLFCPRDLLGPHSGTKVAKAQQEAELL